LAGVYVFGSYSRGEEKAESDLDVLIVLDYIWDYGAEIDFTGELVSEVSQRHNVSISRKFVTAKDWEGGDSLFLRNVREDAVAL
jgi:predicted nucleotidyltransferase